MTANRTTFYLTLKEVLHRYQLDDRIGLDVVDERLPRIALKVLT